MQLSRHFSLREMTVSQAAARRGLDNRPGPAEVEALMKLCFHVLQPLRDQIGPLIITSGYRAPLVNRAVGGSSTSQHRFGEAADFIHPRLSPAEVCKAAVDLALPFDQLIEEFGEWTHVSYGPRMRKQVLRARRVRGETVYSLWRPG